MATKKSTKSTKGKKKTWFEIVATAQYNNEHLGETAAYQAEDVIGRTFSLNLMTLTNDIKSQHVTLNFKVNEMKGEKAIGFPIGYEVMPSHVKRIVRRRRNRVDDVFMAKSKDEKVITYKILLVTANHVSHSVETRLQLEARTYLFNQSKKTQYEQLFDDILRYKLQKSLKNRISKIYPVRSVEVRVFKLEDTKKFVQPVIIKPAAPKKKKLEKPADGAAKPGEKPTPKEEQKAVKKEE